MRAFVTFLKCNTGEFVDVGPGEFLGRSNLAELCIEDPRVSEAHAMVSLRGQSLVLLSLRGRFRVEGKVLSEVVLGLGVRIELAPDIELECVDIQLPTALPGLEMPGLPAFAFNGTTSVWLNPPRIAKGFDANADAVFWGVGPSWRATIQGATSEVEPGSNVRIGDAECKIVLIPLNDAGLPKTRQGLHGPLRFLACGHSVEVRGGDSVLLVGGVPGRILDALFRNDCRGHWREIADCVWPDDASMEHSLRRRFDSGLARLRDRLEGLVEDGFIVLDGSGIIGLNMRDKDGFEISA